MSTADPFDALVPFASRTKAASALAAELDHYPEVLAVLTEHGRMYRLLEQMLEQTSGGISDSEGRHMAFVPYHLIDNARKLLEGMEKP